MGALPKSSKKRISRGLSGGLAPDEKSGGAATSGPRISPRRRFFFRLATMLLVPLVALGLLEACLRIAGYGHSTSVFQKARIGGEEYLVNNDEFSWLFFPPEKARSPAAFRMKFKKDSGACRIFILGESAAMGDPEPAFGAGRYLEALLRQRYPAARFEVINLGITAINSHVVLPIARECAEREGDIWIIYMGNNEMVGPFGAATVFGARALPSSWVRLNIALKKTRLGQLVLALAQKIAKTSDSGGSWAGMEMFAENIISPQDPRKEAVYKNFEKNLGDILRAGLGSHARILLNTVAVNLRDCPPFASYTNLNLPASDRSRLDQLCLEAVKSEGRGDAASASKNYEQACGIDEHNAGLEFRLGECLLQLSNYSSARGFLQRACDDDSLPFRADSRINGIIARAAKEFAGPSLALLDAATLLGSNAVGGMAGSETFYEHVHFKFDGSYQLARMWGEAVGDMLPEAIKRTATNTWASQEACNRWLGLTDWNRFAVIQSVVRRMRAPPLSGQPNNEERMRALNRQAGSLQAGMTSQNAQAAAAAYQAAIQQRPDDYYLHDNYAEFLLSIGDVNGAAAQWQAVHELVPQDFVADYRLGEVLARLGREPEAESLLQTSIATHPGFGEAWMALGGVHTREERLEQAVSDYGRAMRLQPADPQICFEMGKARARLRQPEESIRDFREAVRLWPEFWQAHYLLAGELGLNDRIAEAKAEYEKVIALQPDYAMAHLNLGVAFMKLGMSSDARREFEETLRLEPENKTAISCLTALKAGASH